MKPFCPHCGADLTRDEPILINDFSMMGMGYPLVYQNKPIKMTRGEIELCWTLMKGYPAPIRTDVILNRIGSESETNAVAVLVCRIRARMAEMGIPCPIENIRGYGYRWRLI